MGVDTEYKHKILEKLPTTNHNKDRYTTNLEKVNSLYDLKENVNKKWDNLYDELNGYVDDYTEQAKTFEEKIDLGYKNGYSFKALKFKQMKLLNIFMKQNNCTNINQLHGKAYSEGSKIQKLIRKYSSLESSGFSMASINSYLFNDTLKLIGNTLNTINIAHTMERNSKLG